MKTVNLCRILFAGFIMLVSAPVAAQMNTPATHAILVDVETGAVLLDKNANDRMPTSSMSKTMTMYMVFEALKQGQLTLDQKLPVSEKAWRKQGSKMFVEVGDKVRVEDLIRGVVIQSGNDATIVLAEGLGGTEEGFAQIMTARAKALGMENSNFVNASGWPHPDHYSTARDLAILAYRMVTDFPEYYHYWSEKEFTYNKIRQPNRNWLINRNIGVDGLKTGHTEDAGYGMIASAERNGRRLILVVNGLGSEKERADEAARLLEWGFKAFENRVLVSTDEIVDTVPVWLGEEREVPLVVAEDIKVTLPIAQRKDVKLTTEYMAPLKAPVKKGDEVGILRIEIPGQPVIEQPVLANQSVAEKGFFARAMARAQYLLLGSI